MNPALHSNDPLKYSLEWSRHIVDLLYQKYPRATNFIVEVFGMNIENLAHYLARGDPLWPEFRNLVHYANCFFESGRNVPDVTIFRAEIKKHSHYRNVARIRDRLTQLDLPLE